MPTSPALIRRIIAYCVTVLLCATLANTAGQAVARADSRNLLSDAIATTQGSYLVYNFGGGHPAPMLNAAGNWYEMNNGGHLMTIKCGENRDRLLAAKRPDVRLSGRQLHTGQYPGSVPWPR